MKIVSLSENTLLILFDQKISHDVFKKVSATVRNVENELSDYIIDLIPSYASIQIFFNLNKLSHSTFRERLSHVITTTEKNNHEVDEQRIMTIPVYYGKEVALDIELIAETANLSVDEVIKIHSDSVYDVYAIGFAPGFAYLGNVDERIALPRKETPRKKITQGSLGIADQQTAIYPSDSPGGWQIVGKTPITLVDYQSEKLTQFEAGYKVKFDPISREEFISMGGVL